MICLVMSTTDLIFTTNKNITGTKLDLEQRLKHTGNMNVLINLLINENVCENAQHAADVET